MGRWVSFLPDQDVYRCPAGALLPRHMTTVENGPTLHRYWDQASCQACTLKPKCTPSVERRVTRWEHEATIDDLQRRRTSRPAACGLGAGSLNTLRHHQGLDGIDPLPHEAAHELKTEIGLHILAYNLKRVIQIVGAGPLMTGMRT